MQVLRSGEVWMSVGTSLRADEDTGLEFSFKEVMF